jgi:F-type H+-transporting ATPase subunit alpha
MKQVAGKLKLDLAQYREMAAFSQFESDLDEETKKLLNRGAKVTQVLKQDKNKPYSLEEEVVVLWASHKGYLDQIPVPEVESFEKRLLELMRLRGSDILQTIRKEKIITPETEKKLEKLTSELINTNRE